MYKLILLIILALALSGCGRSTECKETREFLNEYQKWDKMICSKFHYELIPDTYNPISKTGSSTFEIICDEKINFEDL